VFWILFWLQNMNSYPFRKVHGKANRRVRGLWLRNDSYYVQCTITHPSTGLKRVTKLRLEHADTLEQAKIEAAKVKENASKGQGWSPEWLPYVAETEYGHWAVWVA
jgi:hypothetical protein